MRHAKSSWAVPGLDDRDRPLNRRGRAAAPVMARWLAAEGLVPEVILASSARRVRQTVKRMRKAVAELPEPVILPEFYHASPEVILQAVRGAPPDAATLLAVGHEPALSAAAAELSDGTAPPERTAALGHFPTAAVAVFALQIAEWRDLGWGQGRFTAFARPRDLMQPPSAAR